MKQFWTDTELGKCWTLTDQDYALLKGKAGPGRFAIALKLKYYQLYAQFPESVQDFPNCIVDYVSTQINHPSDDLTRYVENSRTARQHRRFILSHLKISPFDGVYETSLRHWLMEKVLPQVPNASYQDELITAWFINNKVERPGTYRLERVIKSTEREFEKRLFQTISQSLSKTVCRQLDALLTEGDGKSDFSWIRSDIRPVSLASVLQAIDKLERLRQLGIPADILKGIHPKLISRYRQRAATENAWEHRRHPPSIRYPLLVFYCVVHESEIIDTLVDLLIQVIHKLSVRSERKVINELISNITQVHGKNTILFHIAEAATGNPDGTVREVIFPVAPEDTMNNLVKELLHIRRRFINKDSLREAIRQVVNATFRVRSPKIWGEATTTCASDSTQVGAWDQNLMTEWHIRYGGPGVMIYWHVDENATCIYSQLKRCSSSEVASMIEGVLHHCTDKEVKQHYVDSHGQSVVAFAFCHLLGLSLMPRFKGIDKIKLVQPQKGSRKDYPNIESIFQSKPIKWKLIAQQYDELIKLTTALREFTAQPEAILRRFTRHNAQHPTYRALIELGRAIKTIFVCNYLMSEVLRQEINTGLNVIERWHGVNDFIYFGKAGELSTNKADDQEISILSLHLLQMSLVYINTLMIQQILAESVWFDRMTERDMAALTPLPHSHLNPYGQFELDMDQRLELDEFPIAA